MNVWEMFGEGNEKPTPHEKFKQGVKRAGYDMDAGAKRLEDLLAKQKAEREAREKDEQKTVSEAQDEVDYDDDYQDMVRRVGEKAKAADALKAQGKEPQTKFNPKTGRYYVDHGQDNPVKENAEELSIGDPVIITGDVRYKGETGDIDSFGDMKRFVVVHLYNHGKHSFHSSDVGYNEYADHDDLDEAGYGRNRGYNPGFASPHAPALGGRRHREDDEGWGQETPVTVWYILANGKLIKDKMGVPYHYRDKEVARKAAMTMMSKPFNAGKKFVLTTKAEDNKPENEAVLHTQYKHNRFKAVRQRDQAQDKAANMAMNRVNDEVGEGRMVKGPGGVPLDRQGRPIVAKAKPLSMRKWLVTHDGSHGEGGKDIIEAPNAETAWELANEYDLYIIDIKPYRGPAGPTLVAEDSGPKRFKVTYKLQNGEVKEKTMIGKDANAVAKYFEFKYRHKPVSVAEQGVAEGKVKLYTDPSYFGAEVDDAGFDSLPVVNIPTNRLVGFEPDSKMQQPKAMANVKNILAGLEQGDNIPPILVRKYKNGYQVLDGHHRFWAYKVAKKDTIPARVVDPKDIEEVGKQGVAETTGDKPFDNMMKTIKQGTNKQKTADRKEQQKQTQQRARDAFGNMFGGGNPADKLSIRKGVAEERTETKNEKGEVTSWRDESDWRKVSKDKDGRGRVTNLSDKARRETEKLKKGKSVDEGQLDEGWKSAMGGAALAGAMALGGGAAHAQSSGEDFLPDIVAHVTFKVNGNTVTKDINLGTAFKSPGDASAALEKFLKSKGIKFYEFSLERVSDKEYNNNYLDKTPATNTDASGSIDSGPYSANGSSSDYMAKESIDEAVDRAVLSMMEDGYEFTEEKVRLDPKCWTGKKIGNPKTKMKGGVRVNNCVPK